MHGVALAAAKPGESYHFERKGYFCVDSDSTPGKPVFNRTVTLRDTWAKIQKQQKSCLRLRWWEGAKHGILNA
jgi:glutaminyl-tRNA synthetase